MSDKREFKAFSDWRGKFVLIISGAAVLLILAHLYFSTQYMEDSIVEQFQRHQVTVTGGMVKGIKARLRNIAAELSLQLAKDPRILGRDRSGYAAALQGVYEELKGFVHGLYRIDTRGVILMRYPPKQERLGQIVPEKALLKKVLAAPGVTILGPFSSLIGEYIVSLVAPAFEGRAPVGAVRAVISLGDIAHEFILPAKVTEHSYAFLMDKRGLIFWHPRKEYGGKTLEEIGRGAFFKMFPWAKKGEAQDGSFRYKDGAGGGVELVAFSSIDVGGQGLVLVLVTPREDIAGPIKEYKRRNGAFAGLLLLIVAFVAYKYTDSRNRRVLLEQERDHFLRERELAEEVRASEAKSRALLEGSPVCIKLLDLDFRLQFMSAAGQEMLCITDINPFYGQPYPDIYAEPHRARITEHLERARAGKLTSLEAPAYDMEGREGWYHTTFVSVRDGDGRVEYIISTSVDITERKQAEEELQQSFEELGLLYSAGQTVIKGLDLEETLGFIVRETPAFLGATHCYVLLVDEDRNELVGVAATEPYWADFQAARIRMDERSAAAWVLTHNEPLVSSRAWEDKRLNQRLTEQYRVRSAVFLPLFVRDRHLGVLIYAHDEQEGAFDHLDKETLSRFAGQTALAVANVKLFDQVKATRDYLDTLIEQSMDAIVATDRSGKLALFNKGAEELSGYRRDEVIGRRGPVLYARQDDAKEVMRRMREGDGTVSGFETTFRSKDGSLIPVLISASILYDEDGQEAGAVGFSKDLRVRKRAEEALIQSEKLAALGRLTAGVSHEILNPLTVIILGLHRTINNPDTHPEIKSDLQGLRDQADRITKIVEDLLYFARYRLPERRSIDFNDIIKRTLSLLENELTLRSIAVDLRLAEEIPVVSADHDQIQQVILNLLTNARDAMPDGGRLVLSTEMVQTDGRKFVELRVEDTGEGIAPEHMEQLFDPFFTTKPEGKGTGLGLSICKGIVEAHEGSIRAENVPEGGAVFVVRLGVEERKREGE
ncbi:MAG: PAS domain S-box protein [bacterium]|nr:PAS domain S-box protein [bacterium]